MAGLAGIIYRKKSNNGSADEKRRIYKNSVEKMLGNISHRGSRSRALTFMDNKDFAAVAGFISNYDIEDNPGAGQPGSKAFNSNVMLDGKIYNTDKVYFSHKKGKASLTDENRMLEEIVTGFDSNIIKKLDGQFAMVLNDRNKNIYLLRDFLGRKPLYFGYSDDNDTLFFASEVKAMAMFCSNVIELAPGHFIKNNQSPVMFRELDFKKYQEKFKNETSFRAQQEYDDNAEINNITNRIEDLLLKSIEKRIPTCPVNIKIGAWLSGGLDSSIIAALLKHFKQDV
jgi:asparagine synthase (glutamine-hydrolysing)